MVHGGTLMERLYHTLLHRSVGAYARHLTPKIYVPGKRNTQKIKRKHLTLRTRIKRLACRTLCFSQSTALHDIVIDLFVNRYEFGLQV